MREAEVKLITIRLVHGEIQTTEEDHGKLPLPERHLFSAYSSSLISLHLKTDDEYTGGWIDVLNKSPQHVTGFCLWGEWRAESMARDKLVIFAADMQEGHLTQGKFKQTSGVQGYRKINSYSEAVLPKRTL